MATCVARALGFYVADGRKPVFQRPARVHRGQDRAVLRRLLQQLLVVVGRRDVTLQQHVGVRVDQARKAGLLREIEHTRSTAAWRDRAVSNFGDSSVLHYARHVRARRLIGPVDQSPAAHIAQLFGHGAVLRGGDCAHQ